MKIGVIGSGIVGRTLAQAFKAEGNDVLIGTRDPAKENIQQFSKEAQVVPVTFEEAAQHSELIVLAVKGIAAEEAIMLAGIQNLKGKIVIDTTNPIDEKQPPVNGALQFFTKMNESLMERLQAKVPDAKFVKAFNSVGAPLMYKPQLAEGKPTMFICGNDPEAKKAVASILGSFGWDTEDAGMVNSAGALEALCVLWCARGFLQNKWMHAFKLLKG